MTTTSARTKACGIIGGGAWGLALASAATRGGASVLLHSRRGRDAALPSGVSQTQSLEAVAKHSRLILLAVPSEVARDVCTELGAFIDGSHYVVHGVRGLAGESLATVSDLIREETPARRVGALGGPALAQDLSMGTPAVIVCGSQFPEVCDVFADAFTSPTLRVYRTDDLRGLEWASALVGCVAILVGYAEGLSLSPGLIAALISRSVGEASRIAAAAGGEERTLLGLAGYGDLLASVRQTDRPEVALGRALSQGKSMKEATEAAKLRVEAIELIPRVVAFADKSKVRAPIFHALSEGLLAGKAADAVLHELMTSPEQRA